MKLVRPFIFLIIFFQASGVKCDPSTPTDDRPPKKEIKVMTYNVHHCNPPSAGEKIDVPAIAKVINVEKPDLVALQEIDVNTIRSGKGINQARLLAELTGMKFFFSKAIDHQGGEYGVAVLSRFPIADSMKLSLPIHPDKPEELRTVAAVRVVLASGQSLLFASTHLGLKEPNRLLQAEKIVEHFGKNDLPMIIGGDFNATPESKVIQYFDQHFSRTCISDCAPTIPVNNPTKTIDFIMFNDKKSLEVVDTRVISEKYASDHLPVVTRLRLK
jgi:endonuclease/exonuclease/phosphatase family metal-dependent hydrolase